MNQAERIASLEARVAMLERLHGPRCAADEPVLLALLEITRAGKFRTRDVRERLRIDPEFREIFNAAWLDTKGIGYWLRGHIRRGTVIDGRWVIEHAGRSGRGAVFRFVAC